ncbi:NusB/RsmB/TIM44 [Deinococcus proteolyticus MRP]|uniref:NusB/RsmB/TIM44 n=1 Tax=Deinococcus proteolyticus (strain ATCC 35074 / DSM 20540 / JCM 6276 / NBRC 101906 / NCIMB 13154 / VKM Ac-1939 / CCM 2703 / MRP) TaxID=693977 RepID=F0RNL7_DEIPM|nr:MULTISPECIES: transcription antitermination factor NusB [Deinococcus]ADY26343.1 NusB/RsmB/TIM44 [Deinococcus proteolyticus MRP]MCY1702462.1 tRNA/rRNA cytosine-C5-methylase [Deinococcus sp. SL84]
MSGPAKSTLNPGRALAVRVLHRVLSGDSYAAPALDASLASAGLPARDAGLATHIVYGTLRRAPALRLALNPLLRGKTAPKAWALLLAGAFEKLYLGTPEHAVVNEYVSLARESRFAPPGLVNAVLRRVQAPQEDTPEARYALPAWLAEELGRVYGEQAADVMESLLEPQPLWLHLGQQGPDLLESEGSLIERTVAGIDAVTLDRPLRQTAAYRQGQAQPVNPASAAVVTALGEVRGQKVYDLAGGAGIKAALLALAGADVTSVELQPHKHAAARSNLKRLHARARLITHDLTRPLDAAPASLVLLDAPCTGSGTLRAHPEIKARLTPQAVGEMAELQAQLLDNAAALVEAGGLLVYSVCSVFPQEGPQRVQAFLASHPDFSAEPLPDLGVPTLPAEVGVFTVPLDGLDGFYMARLRRQ